MVFCDDVKRVQSTSDGRHGDSSSSPIHDPWEAVWNSSGQLHSRQRSSPPNVGVEDKQVASVAGAVVDVAEQPALVLAARGRGGHKHRFARRFGRAQSVRFGSAGAGVDLRIECPKSSLSRESVVASHV